MIETPEISVERVAFAAGREVVSNGPADVGSAAATGFPSRMVAGPGETLFSLSLDAARRVLGDGVAPVDVGGVVVATFSHEMRFPSLSVRLVSALGLRSDVPAMDIQIACSAYPYALYVAGHVAADTGRKVLLIDGDLQSRLTDQADAATAPLFSDAATATLVSADASSGAKSAFAFLSRTSDALSCPPQGPVRMDGFGVFSFVAEEVAPFLSSFLREVSGEIDAFVPHQANMYMVRRLARSVGLQDALVTCGGEFANPGSCSVPIALARTGRKGRFLLAGFGAGLSASACIVRRA
jgi:3-oxoacyl-[acyl-carrier-protein] synthase-3